MGYTLQTAHTTANHIGRYNWGKPGFIGNPRLFCHHGKTRGRVYYLETTGFWKANTLNTLPPLFSIVAF